MPKSLWDGMGTATSRTACPAPELASLWPRVVRPEHREPSLRSLPASLGARPRPVPGPHRPPTRALAHGAGARIGAGCGAERPATKHEMGPTDKEKCARHQWRKREQRWSNATMK